jgi:signal transduction histidine kinase
LDWPDRLLYLMPLFIMLHMPRWGAGWLQMRGKGGEPAPEPAAQAELSTEHEEIASLLHDTVGQGLTVIAMQARNASRVEDNRQLEAIGEAATHTMIELRRVMGHLHHLAKESSGVVDESLVDVVNRFRAAGLPVGFVACGSDEQVPQALRAVVVRVAREALTNAMKYSPTSAVSVEFELSLRIRLEVRSVQVSRSCAGLAGRASGGNPAPWPSGGQGSRMMHRLVARHGGELHVGPDRQGFNVAITLPLDGHRVAPPVLAS